MRLREENRSRGELREKWIKQTGNEQEKGEENNQRKSDLKEIGGRESEGEMEREDKYLFGGKLRIFVSLGRENEKGKGGIQLG